MRRRYLELTLNGTPHSAAVAALAHQTQLDQMTVRHVLARAEREEKGGEADES
jgi:hypothetical protein